jgi:hypothetical protein
MKHNLRSLTLAALGTLAVAPVLFSTATAQAPTPGERWRSTMSMEMMGMKMPGQTTEICTPKGASQAPAPDDKDCQITNRRSSGTTESFDMACKDGMTGRMEMTQESPTKWSGKMTANSKEGQMTMRMLSEKLPGECDASEMERKFNQMKAEADAATAKQCAESGKSGSSAFFLGEKAICKDAASVKAYCSSARTSAGYNRLAREQRTGARVYQGAEAARYRTILADTGKLCSFNPETVRTQYCGTARQKEDWTFFAEECPELAKPLAQAQCAGRDFTTPVDPPFVKFCGAWSAGSASMGAGGAAGGVAAGGGAAGGGAAGGAAAGGATAGPAGMETIKVGDPEDPQAVKQKASPANAAKEAVQKSKDALKGLFGR